MILGRQSGLGKGLGALIPAQGSAPSVAPPLHKASTTGRFLEIPLDQIDPNPDQPRVYFDHHQLEDLISSIKEQGIIQPLAVSALPSGRYQLIAGERRLRAASIAGLANVPVVVHSVDEQQRLMWAIIENVQRQDLNPIEEAKAYTRLMDEYHLTQEEVASKMGKSRSSVANTTRLLQLPAPIQQALIEGRISSSHARTLLSLPSDAERMTMFQNMLDGNFTVRQVEARVPHTARRSSVTDPNILAAEDQIREKLHCKVRIQQTIKGGGEVRLTYFSQEELQKILHVLNGHRDDL